MSECMNKQRNEWESHHIFPPTALRKFMQLACAKESWNKESSGQSCGGLGCCGHPWAVLTPFIISSCTKQAMLWFKSWVKEGPCKEAGSVHGGRVRGQWQASVGCPMRMGTFSQRVSCPIPLWSRVETGSVCSAAHLVQGSVIAYYDRLLSSPSRTEAASLHQ